jgi:hypothetical protein
MQPPVDLVIRIRDVNGHTLKEFSVPLEDLPPNANSQCPLTIDAALEVRHGNLARASLPPWGNQHA